MPRNQTSSFMTALLLAVAVAGCSGRADQKQERGPPQVGFVVAAPTSVPMPISLGGRTVAFQTSEIRPQVNGLIRRRFFVEGGYVRQGQPLFQIDPSLYQAAVNEASANLTAARAGADAAQAKAERYRPLAAIEAISKQEYADSVAAARQGRAAIAQTGAALETARTNLRFTTVPAPISGRIGRSLSTVGALVSANQTEPLAVIQQLDPIFIDMQQSSAELLALKRAVANGNAAPGRTGVRLKLEDGSDYGFTGTLQFSEVAVNEATGTITLRASFPNPQGVLLPGMFVQASFEEAAEPNAFLVPQQAVQRDFNGEAFVFLVGAGNKTVRRKVAAKRTYGADWVITSGLGRGDRIITQGTGNLKQGMPVRPVPASAPQRVAPRPAPGDGAAKRTG